MHQHNLFEGSEPTNLSTVSAPLRKQRNWCLPLTFNILVVFKLVDPSQHSFDALLEICEDLPFSPSVFIWCAVLIDIKHHLQRYRPHNVLSGWSLCFITLCATRAKDAPTTATITCPMRLFTGVSLCRFQTWWQWVTRLVFIPNTRGASVGPRSNAAYTNGAHRGHHQLSSKIINLVLPGLGSHTQTAAFWRNWTWLSPIALGLSYGHIRKSVRKSVGGIP